VRKPMYSRSQDNSRWRGSKVVTRDYSWQAAGLVSADIGTLRCLAYAAVPNAALSTHTWFVLKLFALCRSCASMCSYSRLAVGLPSQITAASSPA
jgi:hypothetical protein